MQYRALELTQVAPWTPLDSVVIGKLFAAQLSLETDIDNTLALAAYQRAGAVAGFGCATFDLRRRKQSQALETGSG